MSMSTPTAPSAAPGGLGAAAAPPPAPAAQPQQTEQGSDPTQLLVGYGRKFLHEQARDETLDTMRNAKTPEEGIGLALGNLMYAMARDAANKGNPVQDPKVMREATRVLAQDLAELAHASGIAKVGNQQEATRLAATGYAEAVRNFYGRSNAPAEDPAPSVGGTGAPGEPAPAGGPGGLMNVARRSPT